MTCSRLARHLVSGAQRGARALSSAASSSAPSGAPAVAAAADAGAARIMSLLRRILRLHRERLPPPMRPMADGFALSEFRRHLRAKTTDEQWRVFATEWQRYLAMLNGTGDQLAAAAAGNASQGCGGAAAAAADPAEPASATAAIAAGSGDFAESLLPLMSPDQRRQLVKLQQEALALGAEMLGKDAAPLRGAEDAAEGAAPDPGAEGSRR